MSSDDDTIFWEFERNSFIYSDCFANVDSVLHRTHRTPQCAVGIECFCHMDQIVFPITVGFRWKRPVIGVKTYIKVGEECPICFESILAKSNAYLTCCGHAFHKRCIFTAHHTQIMEWNNFVFRCPLCRTDQGCPDEPRRYNCAGSFLDQLENVEILSPYLFPEICEYVNLHINNNHYLGMEPTCRNCQLYRNTGKSA